jgi:hypothetical protein
VRALNNVHGTSRGSNGDTESQKETTTHELPDGPVGDGGSLDDGTDDDDECAHEHTRLASPGVDGRPNEGNGNDGTDLVHGRHDTGPDTGVLDVEEFLEVGIEEEGVEERPIVTVHGRAEETDQAGEVERDRSAGERLGRLFDHGLVESLIAANNLGVDWQLGRVVELSGGVG